MVFRWVIGIFALVSLGACQTDVPTSSGDRNSVIAEAKINHSAELESPFGARLKGSGGGVTTVDGRILKMRVKYFVDDYFYMSVTPSSLGASVEPLRLDKHSNWRELLPDLRAVPRRSGGFVGDKDCGLPRSHSSA